MNIIEIGTKEFSFSILNKYTHKNLIALKMNINKHSYGTFDSPTYIPSFIGSLKNLIQDPIYKNDNLTIENYLENLSTNHELTTHYRLTLEETFDDFSKVAVRNQNSIFFLFKLHKDPFFSYPNLVEGIIYADHVNINSVNSALDDLIEYIKVLT
ncbi:MULTISPECIES: hypothetical protein [Acinetobacter]|nr:MULTISPECIES: hypothetical protein [Acinetobacter]